MQEAQAQWTSFRITYALRNSSRPTNDDALSEFLVSLGASADREVRMTNGHASINTGRAAGNTYPQLNAPFDDTGTTEEWRSWPTRCRNAGKQTT